MNLIKKIILVCAVTLPLASLSMKKTIKKRDNLPENLDNEPDKTNVLSLLNLASCPITIGCNAICAPLLIVGMYLARQTTESIRLKQGIRQADLSTAEEACKSFDKIGWAAYFAYWGSKYKKE